MQGKQPVALLFEQRLQGRAGRCCQRLRRMFPAPGLRCVDPDQPQAPVVSQPEGVAIKDTLYPDTLTAGWQRTLRDGGR